MMSLFIVLWLMNSNAKVKEAVAGYFKDPAGVGKLSGTNKEGRDKTVPPPGAPAKQDMEKLKANLEKAIKSLPNFQNMKDHIAITVTDEGVRMELMETAKGLFCECEPDAHGGGNRSHTNRQRRHRQAAQPGDDRGPHGRGSICRQRLHELEGCPQRGPIPPGR